MNKKYIKPLIILIFLSLYIGQNFCRADVDIAEFKKIKQVKTIFNRDKDKTNSKSKKQKSLKLEETKIDSSAPFSMFEDMQDESFANVRDTKEEKELENSKTNSFFSKFKFKKKSKNKKNEEIIEEETVTDSPITPLEDEYTYINDTDNVIIQEVEIYGNNLLDINYIKDQIKSKEGYQYIRSNVSNDLKALYATVYFTQNIRALPIKIDDRNVKLRIILEENPPIAGFNIIGNNSISNKDIISILDQYQGLPQNILSINNAINEIQELYSSKGYILARVEKVSDDPDGYVNIKIDEGIIGDIIVDGNNKTRDFIVKRNILLQPGSVYNENTMRSDILRLMGTQAFKDVQRE